MPVGIGNLVNAVFNEKVGRTVAGPVACYAACARENS